MTDVHREVEKSDAVGYRRYALQHHRLSNEQLAVLALVETSLLAQVLLKDGCSPTGLLLRLSRA